MKNMMMDNTMSEESHECGYAGFNRLLWRMAFGGYIRFTTSPAVSVWAIRLTVHGDFFGHYSVTINGSCMQELSYEYYRTATTVHKIS